MTVPAILSLDWVTDDDQLLITKLENALAAHQVRNRLKRAYYRGRLPLPDLGIGLPPSLRDVQVSIGWAGTAVDIMNERLEWFGWRDPDDRYGLAEAYAANQLDLEVARAHLDSLMYGVAFLVVGDGDENEPHPLITEHSPATMTAVWDNRQRRLSAALAVSYDDETGAITQSTLYRPYETIFIDRTRAWHVTDRYTHNLGRVPVVPVENRAVTDARGRSEITRPVRYYVDNAMRTIAAMEVHREFHAAPQRYALNVAEDQFKNADGTTSQGWDSIMGRIWALQYDEDRPDSQQIQVGQFQATAPTAYAQHLQVLAEQFSAETGVPVDDLGVQRANPTSEGSLLAAERRLVRRTEFRQRVFTHAYEYLAGLVVGVRDRQSTPPLLPGVSADRWQNAATPSRAAIADETAKLVGAGVLPPQSSVTWDRMGLSPDEQDLLASDLRRAAGRTILERLTDGNSGAAAAGSGDGDRPGAAGPGPGVDNPG